MEITTQSRGWLQSEVQSRAIKIPRYLLAIIILFSGLYVVIMGLRVLVLNTTEPIPLTTLFLNADGLIRQPTNSIDLRGFSCPLVYEWNFNAEVPCYQDLPSRTFFQVRVVSRADTIYRIEFTIHENTLRAGHLFWLWGSPEIKNYSRSVYFFWREQSIYALVPGEPESFSLSRSVWKVCFFRRPM